MIKEKTTIKEKLTTDYYRVLEILCKNETTINGENMVIMTQNQIAEELKLHKMTINAIFRELKNDGLITQAPDKKRIYYISDNGKYIYKQLKKISL